MASCPCPVCGYELDEPTWSDDGASYEICPSCGIEFGFDDEPSGDNGERSGIYESWRRKWIEGGMKWRSQRPEPLDWDPAAQLSRLGLPNYSGMTVNERLFESGLLQAFDNAAMVRDKQAMVELLVRVHIDLESANKTVDAILANPKKYGF